MGAGHSQASVGGGGGGGHSLCLVKGIVNEGNSCYLSSVLQVRLRTLFPSFLSFLLSSAAVGSKSLPCPPPLLLLSSAGRCGSGGGAAPRPQLCIPFLCCTVHCLSLCARGCGPGACLRAVAPPPAVAQRSGSPSPESRRKVRMCRVYREGAVPCGTASLASAGSSRHTCAVRTERRKPPTSS